jgi:hypothetical protein
MYADPNRVLTLPLIETGLTKNPGTQNWVMFIANTNDPYFISNRLTGLQVGTTTFSAFRQMFVDIPEESYSYGGTAKTIMMSGGSLTEVKANIVIDGDDDSPDPNIYSPGVMLYRNEARITLNLTIDQSITPGYKVVSVAMKNVQRRLYILDNWYYGRNVSYPTNFPQTTNTQVFNYDVAHNGDAGFQTTGTRQYTWYIPANAQRNVVGGSFSEATKNAIAPQYASYYEITVADTINFEVIKYTIYPGMNDTNDFCIFPNHLYTNNFRLFGNGGEQIIDSRVTRPDVIDGTAGNYIVPPDMDSSNSFILPRRRAYLGMVNYNVPEYIDIPISQVNRYWGGTAIGYGNDPANMIDPNTVWVVDLLWQDHPDIVRPVGTATFEHVTITAPGALNSSSVLKTVSANGQGAIGKGSSAMFRVSTNALVSGNFVVCIRKAAELPNGEFEATGDVLWSWHFWVTGYNPDAAVAQYKNSINGHQFVYPAPGSGQIERYGGTYWGYSGTAANNWNNYTYAVTTPSNTVPYAKSFMMDRILGARYTNYVAFSATANNMPMYYYGGRKDPFPYAYLYNIIGAQITLTAPAGFPAQRWNSYNPVNVSSSSSTVRYTIGNPMSALNTYSWTDENFTNALWYDNTLNYSANIVNGKSIFDPCPPGWHIPINGFLQDFRNNVTFSNASRGLAYSNSTTRYYPYYTPDGGVTYPVSGDILYPAVGYGGYVGISGSGSYNYYWVVVSHSTNLGYCWVYNGDTSGGNNNTINNGFCFNVRCVSMPPN